MLCCSVFAILLGQCGAFGAALKVRLAGGGGVVGSAMAAAVAGWPVARWLVAGTVVAGEFVLAAAAWPALRALDMPSQVLGAWPLCAALAEYVRR